MPASAERPAAPRILVIRGGAIGDFVLTLPVLSALRARFPQCQLTLLGYPHIAGLALAGGLVDDLRPIESRALAGFFAEGGQLDEALAGYFGGCSLILSYLYDPDRIFERNVGRCTRAQFVAGRHRPSEAAGRHATAVFLEPLQRLAIFGTDPVPRLDLAVSGDQPGREQMPGCVALHPGSGSERKNWPESNWAQLLEQVLAAGAISVTLVGGEAEGDRLDRLAAGRSPTRVRVARSLPLVELARVLARCVAFVGHDSGITHLAAALGLPALVLWGPSQENVWRPQGEGIVLLRAADGLERLSVSTVVHGLLELLSTCQQGPDAK
jgi:heptosyltransferase III